MSSLTKYDAARKALAEAHSVDEAKDIRNKAEALRVYAKQAKDIDMQNWAAEIRVRAERRAGELLKEIPKQYGARGVGKKVESSSATPLSELEVTKDQSSKWQKLADVPALKFEKALREIMGLGKELTTTAMLRAIKPSKQIEIDCWDELIKQLQPLLPIGADGQPKLAELLERAIGAATESEQVKLCAVVAMLQDISKHFADCAEKLAHGVQVAKVA